MSHIFIISFYCILFTDNCLFVCVSVPPQLRGEGQARVKLFDSIDGLDFEHKEISAFFFILVTDIMSNTDSKALTFAHG